MIFGPKKIGPIGLDVSDQSIELAQVRAAEPDKATMVKGFGRIELDGGIIKEGHLEKPAEFKEAVRALLSAPTYGSFDGKMMVLSMPEHQCYHHIFAINAIGDGLGLYRIVQESLVAALPFDLDEVLWDWMIVRQDGTSIVVYAVAVLREVVNSYQEALQSIGITLMAVEPQVYSATRVFWPGIVVTEPVLSIDFGARETTVATMDDFGIHQSSVVPVGTVAMREAVMVAMKADAQTAEKILRTIGLRQLKHPNISLIHEAIKAPLKRILEEAQQHMAFYHSQRHVTPGTLSTLVMSGGGSLIPGVPEALAGALKLKIQPLEAAGLYQPAFAPEDFVLYINALGAARRPALSDSNASVNVLITRREHTPVTKKWFSSMFKSGKGGSV